MPNIKSAKKRLKQSLVSAKRKRILSSINLHIESNDVSRENKKPRKDEQWLAAYNNQCEEKAHSKKDIANVLGIVDTTFRIRLLRNKDKINITYRGTENCKICHMKASQNQNTNEENQETNQENLAQNTSEVNKFSTPKRKILPSQNSILCCSTLFVII